MLTSWRKSQARKAALKTRAGIALDPHEAGRALIDHFPDEAWPRLNSIVAGYRAIGSEIDPAAMMETFFCEQVRLALPVVIGPGQPLVFRSWAPGEALVKGAYKIEEPGEDARALTPNLVLVPLLGFDGSGRRLGYGGGYYDRTLSALKNAGDVTLVGLAFEAQKIGRVPSDAYDVGLDYVVTEQRSYKF